MLQSRLRPFICRQCLARRALNSLSPAGSSLHRPAVSKTPAASRFLSSQPLSQLFNQLNDIRSNRDNVSPPVDTPFEGEIPEWLPARERLKAWDTAHPQGQISPINEFLITPHTQDTRNIATGVMSSMSHRTDRDPEEEDDPDQDLPQLGEDFQANSIFMNPGDLIEFRTGATRIPLLAVFICQRDGQGYYYRSDGCLYMRFRPATNFVAPGFATEAEMASIKDRLPPPGTPVSEVLDRLRSGNDGPTREDGQTLLNKMAKFVLDTDLVLQENHRKLDSPYPILAKLGYEYVTSHEAAEHLLSGRTKGSDGKFPPAAIYAVHRAMQNCETGIRVFQGAIFDMKSCLFEVLPFKESECISAIEVMVRELYTDPLALKDGFEAHKRLMTHKIGDFIIRARQKIDQVRTERQFKDQCPVMGLDQRQNVKKDLTAEPWLLPDDYQIMKFMHLWAAKQAFDSDSKANVFGSQILRAIRRYDGTEFLGKVVGWRFLQEVGWILPWDVQTRYSKAVPGTTPDRAGGLGHDPGPLPAEAFTHDAYPGTRKDWGELPAFAIDAAETEDIDDAVSVERTSTAGQFWMHVHVADVASLIQPNSAHAQYAERVSETHYFPGHFARMLPDSSIRKNVSLAPGSRALTFSGLVNEQGELIEYKITPGILRNVVNIDPREVAKICPQTLDPDTDTTKESSITLCVGQRSGSYYESLGKKTKSADDLSAHETEDLKLLDRLATSLYLRRKENHASPDHNHSIGLKPVPKLWPANTQSRQASDGTFSSSGDMTIEVALRSPDHGYTSNLVTHSMILAGEIAGRWCEDRGIPVPYRTMPQAVMNKDFLLHWVENHMYPLFEANEEPTPEDVTLLKQLAGPAILSTNPGLHFWLGLKHYVKVTSPMRRYLDVIAHFQIHAALAEEARTGETLQPPQEGEKEHTFLPFTRTDLTAKLPLLAVREAMVRTLSTGRPHGHKEYVYQALARAFYFNEAPLPSTFEFHVRDSLTRQHIRGVLPGLWNLLADLPCININGVVESPSMLVKDDIIEVRLIRVNPFNMELHVEAVRPVRVGGEDVMEEHHTSVAAGDEALGDAHAHDVSGQASA